MRTSTPSPRDRHRRSPALPIVAAALAVLAGCGSSSTPPVASIPTSSAGTTAAASTPGSTARSGSQTTEASPQHSALEYSRCMRANGVPSFPDPSTSGGFLFAPGSGIDPSSPTFKKAQAACATYMGGLAPGAQTHPSPQWLAHMLAVAKCMRRRGVSGFPDPRTSVPSRPPVNGMISDIDGVVLVFPATVDTQSPAFAQSAKTCGFPMHNH